MCSHFINFIRTMGCNRKKRDSGDDFELHTVSSSHPIRRVEQVIELDEISIETSDSNGI